MSKSLIQQLSLRGLFAAPSQTFGVIRLIPLVRTGAEPALRFDLRKSDAWFTSVDTGSAHYSSFIPHSYVVRLDDGSTEAALGAQLFDQKHHKKPELFACVHRMAKHEDGGLRFLPLHLAMEHFMALCFGGPDVAWPEYSRKALRKGLSPRFETSYGGRSIDGLDEALRMFEIHDGQVGVALFVADALASVFVVPRPEDYRRVHRSLLRDFYGELLWHYARLYDRSADLRVGFDASRVSSVATLTAELARVRLDWQASHALMLDNVIGRPVQSTRVSKLGHFVLERFTTTLELEGNDHIGEAIVDEANREIVYLKTYRLSGAQSRRGHLLQTLAAHDWHIDRTAAALTTLRPQLIDRIVRAGFGDMLKPEVLAEIA